MMYFISLKSVFILANSADSNDNVAFHMDFHNVVFDLGLHCLPSTYLPKDLS